MRCQFCDCAEGEHGACDVRERTQGGEQMTACLDCAANRAEAAA